MAVFDLRLFGGFDLRFAKGANIPVGSKKGRALIAYLALHRGVRHSREQVASLLWENSAEEQARSSLRQALSTIRKSVPGYQLVHVAGDVLTIYADAIEVDVLKFADKAGAVGARNLAEALDLYAGPLLQGLNLKEDGFESWLRFEREKWHDLAISIQAQLLDLAQAAGDDDKAESHAKALLELNPMREDAHRGLMRIYTNQARIGAALQQYQICRDLLQKELGIDPDPQTEALYRAIFSQGQAHAATPDHLARASGPDDVAAVPRALSEGWKSAPRVAGLSGGERRQLTIMVAEFDRHGHRDGPHDPEDINSLAQTFIDRTSSIVGRYGGTLAQSIGNRVVAYFGYPQAHEDDARRAAHAALAMLDVNKSEDEEARPELGFAVGLRLSINTGPVIIRPNPMPSSADFVSVIGDTATVAMHLPGVADANQAVIGFVTAQIIGNSFDCQPIGSHAVKGVPFAVQAFRLVGPRTAAATATHERQMRATPLVGRDLEVQLLIERWNLAVGGDGQLVNLMGEPGIGKSRIVQALQDQLQADVYTLISLQGSPYFANTAFYPIVQQFAAAAGITPYDSNVEKLAKLKAMIDGAGMPLADALHVFAEAMALPLEGGDTVPQDLNSRQRRELVSEALAERAIGLSKRQPVLILVEDAHWMDPSTLDAINRTTAGTQNQRVMHVVTSRPGFSPPWSDRGHATTLTLNRLSRRQSLDLVRNLSVEIVLPDDMVDRIVDRSDGIPLFIEELTNTVMSTQHLGPDHQLRSDRRTVLPIPDTLQDALMARLDRYPSAHRLAQQASCLGRDCVHDVVAAISELDAATLHESIDQLVEAGVAVRHGSQTDADFSFKHALLRDAAYGSILREDRQRMHGRIAEVLSTRFAKQMSGQPETLAHHFASAGDAKQAMHHWLLAGRAAAARSANAEAVEHLNAGLAMKLAIGKDQTRDRLEMELLIALFGPLSAVKGHGAPELEGIFERVRHLSGQLNDRTKIYSILYGQFVFHHVRGEIAPALDVADTYLDIAVEQNSVIHRVNAYRLLGAAQAVQGAYAVAGEYLTLALSNYDTEAQRETTSTYGVDAKVVALNYQCIISWIGGYPDQADRLGRESRRHADRIGHDHSLAQALAFGGTTLQFLRGQHKKALKFANQLADLASERKYRAWKQFAKCYAGCALVGLGRLDDGIARLQDGLSRVPEASAALFSLFYCALANGYHQLGEHDQALAALAVPRAQADGRTAHWWAPELMTCEAVFLIKRDPDAAEQGLVDAMALADRQNARSWHLRAATRLAGLRNDRGDVKAAYETLAPALAPFTEGFDTADLKDAKTLLDALK